MNLKSRKIISMALVFFMMLTILPLAPVTAFAAGSAGYFELGVVDGAANKWNVQISDAGVLSWDSQGDGATYEIQFAYTELGYTRTFVKDLDKNSCDLKKVFEDRSIENGTYYFVISAKVGGTSSSNVVAGHSFPLSLKYVSSLPKLAEPRNLSWDGTTAKWDSVPNATRYDVYIYATDGTTPDYRFDIAATEYNFGSYAKDGRWFEVVAVADGYRDSNAAESPKFGTGSSAGYFKLGVVDGAANNWNV
ncbi:MAG: hypothetical protein II218_05055, partial [Peptococcaceae bacterium]|nr:hypothetical protein [Peptococcaceae bacterium]